MSQHMKTIREICRDIGCSGVDPDMCQNNPQNCNIIRKAVRNE